MSNVKEPSEDVKQDALPVRILTTDEIKQYEAIEKIDALEFVIRCLDFEASKISLRDLQDSVSYDAAKKLRNKIVKFRGKSIENLEQDITEKYQAHKSAVAVRKERETKFKEIEIRLKTNVENPFDAEAERLSTLVYDTRIKEVEKFNLVKTDDNYSFDWEPGFVLTDNQLKFWNDEDYKKQFQVIENKIKLHEIEVTKIEEQNKLRSERLTILNDLNHIYTGDLGAISQTEFDFIEKDATAKFIKDAADKKKLTEYEDEKLNFRIEQVENIGFVVDVENQDRYILPDNHLIFVTKKTMSDASGDEWKQLLSGFKNLIEKVKTDKAAKVKFDLRCNELKALGMVEGTVDGSPVLRFDNYKVFKSFELIKIHDDVEWGFVFESIKKQIEESKIRIEKEATAAKEKIANDARFKERVNSLKLLGMEERMEKHDDPNIKEDTEKVLAFGNDSNGIMLSESNIYSFSEKEFSEAAKRASVSIPEIKEKIKKDNEAAAKETKSDKENFLFDLSNFDDMKFIVMKTKKGKLLQQEFVSELNELVNKFTEKARKL